MPKLSLFRGLPFDSELEPSGAMSARPVSLLIGEGAFLMPLYACRCPFFRSDNATPPDNEALLASMASIKTGDGASAGRCHSDLRGPKMRT